MSQATLDTPESAMFLDAELGGPVMDLRGKVVEAIKGVYDPEVPVNIYDMGLIYNIDVGSGGHVRIDMTLTAPACPAAQSLPERVREQVETIPEVETAQVEIVWEPPWSPDLMTEAARLELGMM